jgi:hypothetical protein
MAKVKAKKTKTARANTTTRRALRRRSPIKSKPKRKATTRLKQTFVVSHHNEADFREGLRAYARYRDLGISKATNGLAQAHVMRLIGPCDPKVVSKRHYHDVDSR